MPKNFGMDRGDPKPIWLPHDPGKPVSEDSRSSCRANLREGNNAKQDSGRTVLWVGVGSPAGWDRTRRGRGGAIAPVSGVFRTARGLGNERVLGRPRDLL